MIVFLYVCVFVHQKYTSTLACGFGLDNEHWPLIPIIVDECILELAIFSWQQIGTRKEFVLLGKPFGHLY